MTNFRIFFWLSHLCLVAAVYSAPEGYHLAKEKGVTYIKDILEPRQMETLAQLIRFKTLKPTALYATKDAQTQIGTLLEGQMVELEGFTRFAVRVRGKTAQGIMVGWANPRDLEPAKPDVLENLRKLAERRERVLELIRARQVAIGMTTDEVAESKGEPTKRTARQAANGSSEIWEYIDYEVVPRFEIVRDAITGATYKRFAYNEKIEKGKFSIEFVDGVVSALEESEDLSKGKEARIVPVPIDCGWP